MTKEFIEKAKAAKPVALLTEGTRMGHDEEHNYTEKEVEDKVDRIVKESKGLVFTYFSMSNVDRFMSVYHAAVKNKRKLVIDTKFAYILDNLKEKINALPDVMADKNIQVYFRLAKTGTYSEKDYFVYERKYMPKMVTYKDIAKNQKGTVMHMSFNKLMELVYIQPKDADYIYSSSEHFLEGEENAEEKRVLDNWMTHFGVKFHKAHCSGHASREDLEKMVGEIKPEILIPIHTESAEEFKKFHKNVKVPKQGEKIEIYDE